MKLLLSELTNIHFFSRRKKHTGTCRWKTPAAIKLLEFPSGCRNTPLGNPKFVRLHSGACNNLTPGRQHWGLFGLPMARLQPADYSGKPVDYSLEKTVFPRLSYGILKI